jgi:hydrogenase nickel incorporation protein HypB
VIKIKVKVMKNIMDANQKIAGENKLFFDKNSINVINVMASPGAGKTCIILKIIEMLRNEKDFYVIEGDISSSIDAVKIDKLGIPVMQINTGGGCHLDANMIKTAVSDLEVKKDSIVFIENVGNLVCPSAFELGETTKLIIASVPEGHDKPFKYTSMFSLADVVILNKMDLMPYIDFDKDEFYKGIREINKKASIFEVSSKTGEGFEELINWFKNGEKNTSKSI